jgi:hypothetical protein
MFRVAPSLEMKKLGAVFRYGIFKMPPPGGGFTKDLITMLSNWRHSGFQVNFSSIFPLTRFEVKSIF